MAHRHQPIRPSRLFPRRLAAVLVFAASCRGGTEPEAVTTLIEVGTLASPPTAALEAPDTVTASLPFNTTVRTVGNACVRSAGGEAAVRGLLATVTPYDMVHVGSFCADILSGATREVQVRFDAAGTATIRAVGANGTTAERSVVVRPLR